LEGEAAKPYSMDWLLIGALAEARGDVGQALEAACATYPDVWRPVLWARLLYHRPFFFGGDLAE
jgi:hypothetical protein